MAKGRKGIFFLPSLSFLQIHCFSTGIAPIARWEPQPRNGIPNHRQGTRTSAHAKARTARMKNEGNNV
jgi:hypothetical protein